MACRESHAHGPNGQEARSERCAVGVDRWKRCQELLEGAADLADDEILKRLFDLNQERARHPPAAKPAAVA